jgi:hypothetical protein
MSVTHYIVAPGRGRSQFGASLSSLPMRLPAPAREDTVWHRASKGAHDDPPRVTILHRPEGLVGGRRPTTTRGHLHIGAPGRMKAPNRGASGVLEAGRTPAPPPGASTFTLATINKKGIVLCRHAQPTGHLCGCPSAPNRRHHSSRGACPLVQFPPPVVVSWRNSWSARLLELVAYARDARG